MDDLLPFPGLPCDSAPALPVRVEVLLDETGSSTVWAGVVLWVDVVRIKAGYDFDEALLVMPQQAPRGWFFQAAVGSVVHIKVLNQHTPLQSNSLAVNIKTLGVLRIVLQHVTGSGGQGDRLQLVLVSPA